MRCLIFRMHLCRPFRQQSVLGHRVENTRLAHDHHDHRRAESEHGTDLDDGREYREDRAHRRSLCLLESSVDSDSDRSGGVGQQLIVDQSDHDAGDEDVEYRTDGQTAEDADRHILLRILGFLCGGRNRVKTDVGKEDDRGSGNDARETIRHELSTARRPGGTADTQIAGVDIADAGDDKEDYDQHLDQNDDRVKACRFLDALDQQQCHADRDQQSGQIYDAVDRRSVSERYRLKWPFTQGKREVYPQCIPEQTDHVA